MKRSQRKRKAIIFSSFLHVLQSVAPLCQTATTDIESTTKVTTSPPQVFDLTYSINDQLNRKASLSNVHPTTAGSLMGQ